MIFLVGIVYLLMDFVLVPYISVGNLSDEVPETTALMQQRMDEASGEGRTMKVRQQWIPLKRVPRYVLDAIIVAEDGTFYSHSGFDWFEVKESIKRNIEEGRAARGASTITQQLAKNLYLSTSKNPMRKLKEMSITFFLERRLSKQRILELYVNVIEWGNGIFGIEAASRAYFGKSASSLTVDEGARLAAVIPSPLRHSPDQNSRYVLRRKNIVLTRMAARNFVPETLEEVPSSPTPEDTSRPPDASVASDSVFNDTSDIDEDERDGL